MATRAFAIGHATVIKRQRRRHSIAQEHWSGDALGGECRLPWLMRSLPQRRAGFSRARPRLRGHRRRTRRFPRLGPRGIPIAVASPRTRRGHASVRILVGARGNLQSLCWPILVDRGGSGRHLLATAFMMFGSTLSSCLQDGFHEKILPLSCRRRHHVCDVEAAR